MLDRLRPDALPAAPHSIVVETVRGPIRSAELARDYQFGIDPARAVRPGPIAATGGPGGAPDRRVTVHPG